MGLGGAARETDRHIDAHAPCCVHD
jgi:hypothetical protein